MALQSYVRTTEGNTPTSAAMARQFATMPASMLTMMEAGDLAAAFSGCVKVVGPVNRDWNNSEAKVELKKMAAKGVLPIASTDCSVSAKLAELIKTQRGAGIYRDIAVILNDASHDGRFASLFATAGTDSHQEEEFPEPEAVSEAETRDDAQPTPFANERTAEKVLRNFAPGNRRQAITLVRAHPRAACWPPGQRTEAGPGAQAGRRHPGTDRLRDGKPGSTRAPGRRQNRQPREAEGLAGRGDLGSAAADLAPRSIVIELLVEELGEGNTLTQLETLRSWVLKLSDREDLGEILDAETQDGRSLLEKLIIALFVENGNGQEFIPRGQYSDYGLDPEQGEEILASLIRRRFLPISLVDEKEEFVDEKELTQEELQTLAEEPPASGSPSPASPASASPVSTPTPQAEQKPSTETAAAANEAAGKLGDLL